MPHRESINEVLRVLRERDSFLITSHARPDGDAVGSALALMHLLEGAGKRVQVAFADPIPVIYQSLPGVHRILSTLPAEEPEVAVMLECDSVARSGFTTFPGRVRVNIDHHQSGRPFADVNWIEPHVCAVGAMIHELAVAAGMDITPAVATCLYTAVLTDTGSFTYASTDAATFALAQHLVERGAQVSEIAQAVYYSNPPGKIRILGAALTPMQIDGPVAWTRILCHELDQTGATVEDCEGVVNYLIGIAGVEAAAVLRELPSGRQFRLSLRSKGRVDVARVAEQFGGGGHTNASGCTLDGPLEAATERIRQELLEAVRKAARTRQPEAAHAPAEPVTLSAS